jgi:hypothetical protein
MPAACHAKGDGRPRTFVRHGAASFDCAISREAGSSAEEDSDPYAKILA